MKIIFYSLLLLISLFPLKNAFSCQKLSLCAGDYSVSLSTSVNDFYTEVDRDFYNGMWEIGYGKELLPISKFNSESKKTYEIADIGLFNTFVGGDGQGIFGVSVGIKTPTLIIKAIQTIEGVPDLMVKLPKWASVLAQSSSVDIGYGNRLFGVPKALASEGIVSNSWDVGIHVNIPFGDLFQKPSL